MLGNYAKHFLCILRPMRAKYTSCTPSACTSCHRLRWYKKPCSQNMMSRKNPLSAVVVNLRLPTLCADNPPFLRP